MFERFTSEARQTVVLAQEEARQLRHERIGTEHLLLALAAQPGTASAEVLSEHGLTRQVVVEAITAYLGSDDLDAEALSTLGIDLDAVRTTVEASFGPGALDKRSAPRAGSHVPFTPRAKKVLELSLREALALKQRHIADGHILLGLLREGEGLAAKVVHERAVEPDTVRRDITSALTR